MIDLGGQWGGKTHHLFRALSDELNLKRYPTCYDGEGVLVWNGTPHTTGLFEDFERAIGFLNPDDIDIPAQEKEAALKLWKELFVISKSISIEQPWTSPDAEILDANPVSDWVSERNASPLAQWMFGWICRGGGAQVLNLMNPRCFIWLGPWRWLHRVKLQKTGSLTKVLAKLQKSLQMNWEVGFF